MDTTVRPLNIKTNKTKPDPLTLKTMMNEHSGEMRMPPSFMPPDLPLPSPKYSQADLMKRIQSPLPSPMSSPFRTAPVELVNSLIKEEETYIHALQVLNRVIAEKVVGDQLTCLTASVERMIDLSCDLRTQLTQHASYFSDTQKDSLLRFSKIAAPAYQAYFKGFRLDLDSAVSAASQKQLDQHLEQLQLPDETDRDLNWLLRRPLSRVRCYKTLYKKLLHSSDDATDLFLAHETFQGLLVEARDALERARKDRSLQAESVLSHSRSAQRSISGGSTSTQSSSNSKLSANDELLGLQNSIDVSHCRDVFSLAPTTCHLDLLPKDQVSRTIVNRDNFQLTIYVEGVAEIDNLVEVILLTDQLLITRPSFEGPMLMFPPLQRGVFHVSFIPSEARILELDIVGRQTMRLTASSKQERLHWYDLLLACEDYKLDSMPVAPLSLAPHVGQKARTPWLPLAPTRMPPTPPPTQQTPTFGGFGPLSVIRENSQLSIAGHSELGARTPDGPDQPFHFDTDDVTTPRATERADPLQTNTIAGDSHTPASDESSLDLTPKAISFPDPPTRSNLSSLEMRKSKSVDLFSSSSYTDQFLRSTPLDTRSKTLQHSQSSPRLNGSAFSHDDDAVLSPVDLDFTKDQAFDETLLDLPTLPAFDFGDGIKRPSSVALKFSPKTMVNFGIPMRKIPQPQPMTIPEVDPLRLPTSKSKDTIAQRRLGNELTLDTKVVEARRHSDRVIAISIMVECYTWDNGSWTPILMDLIDPAGKMKTVRSSLLTIFKDGQDADLLEIFDKQSDKVMNNFTITTSTSIIRDDPCDISVGFDIGFDKVYYMFRCENPDRANNLQSVLSKSKATSPSVRPTLPVTPLWPASDDAAILIESLKLKLYISDNGKWINRGSARLTIRIILNTRNRRVILTGKTKKNQRILLLDCITAQEDCEAVSKTGIALKTKQDTYMMQMKNQRERARILGLLVDF